MNTDKCVARSEPERQERPVIYCRPEIPSSKICLLEGNLGDQSFFSDMTSSAGLRHQPEEKKKPSESLTCAVAGRSLPDGSLRAAESPIANVRGWPFT
jgi:hypothetical protein